MFQYPLKYRLVDCLLEFLFFGILKDNPKKDESRFVRFAGVIQVLKMIAAAGVLAAISCLFFPLKMAEAIWIIASLIFVILGMTAFSAY